MGAKSKLREVNSVYVSQRPQISISKNDAENMILGFAIIILMLISAGVS